MVDDGSTAVNDFYGYIQSVRKARNHERVASSNRNSAQYVQDYVTQQTTLHDEELSEENENSLLVKLLGFAKDMIKKKQKKR